MELAGYEGLSLLASGGCSDLYRARLDGEDVEVAVKVYRFTFEGDRAVRRFRRECDTAAELSDDPNLASLYGAGITDEGCPYLAMELVEGGSVADHLARGVRFGVDEALRVGTVAAQVLAVGHAQGAVHGRFGSENILLATDGAPVVTELGFGLLAERDGADVNAGAMPYHTAPEVLEGAPPDGSSDVYALASVLYTMVAGRPPYAVDGVDSPSALLLRILQGDSGQATTDALPPALETVLAPALAAEPADRPSAANLHQQLDHLTQPGNPPPAPTHRPSLAPPSTLAPAAAGIRSTQPSEPADAQSGNPYLLSALDELHLEDLELEEVQAEEVELEDLELEDLRLDPADQVHSDEGEPVGEELGEPVTPVGEEPRTPVEPLTPVEAAQAVEVEPELRGELESVGGLVHTPADDDRIGDLSRDEPDFDEGGPVVVGDESRRRRRALLVLGVGISLWLVLLFAALRSGGSGGDEAEAAAESEETDEPGGGSTITVATIPEDEAAGQGQGAGQDGAAEEDDDGADDPSVDAEADLEVPGALDAYVSSAGIQLEWFDAGANGFIVVIFSEEDPPRVEHTDSPPLLIPGDTDDGHCFMVARQDMIDVAATSSDEAAEAQNDGPLEVSPAFSDGVCTGGATVDTVRTE